MKFDWAIFFAPLTPTAFFSAFVIGIVFGWVIYGKRAWSLNHVYWMAAAGLVFCVPLALEAGFEGIDDWEHLLSRLVLWNVYVLGTALTPLFRRRWG